MRIKFLGRGLIRQKAIYFLMAFLFFRGPFGLCEEAIQVHELSLKDAILTAYKNNKDIQIDEEGISVAKANILGAKSGFLPKVNLNAGYTRNHKVFLPNIFSGFRNDNQLGAALSESVYDGGATIANFNQAKLRLTVSEETLRAKKLDIEFETKRLYYGLLLAYETERITQNLVDQARAHYEDVKNKFKQGIASRFDVLQSKVQVSVLIPELVKSKNAIDLINADLMKLLNFKMKDSLRPKDRLICAFINIREDDFLKAAYLNKPEMILKSLDIDISKWGIEMAKSGWRPQLDVNLNYLYRAGNLINMFNRNQYNWSAGVSVSLPIFDGFSSKAKVDAAKAQYAQAALDKENLVEQVAVDIRRGCLNLKEAAQVINSQKDANEEALEALRLAGVRFDNGVGINLDVLDAQVSVSQVQKNLAEGIYDYLMAEAFLGRTMGMQYFKEADNENKI